MKQKILDVPRAKWNTYQAMEGYFHTHVQTLVDEGIAYYNDACAFKTDRTARSALTPPSPLHRMRRYDANDRDDAGVPRQPIALWVKGEEWRAVSFDEMRSEVGP